MCRRVRLATVRPTLAKPVKKNKPPIFCNGIMRFGPFRILENQTAKALSHFLAGGRVV